MLAVDTVLVVKKGIRSECASYPSIQVSAKYDGNYNPSGGEVGAERSEILELLFVCLCLFETRFLM